MSEFPIATVSRGDLEDAGFDTSKVTDDQMRDIAENLCNAYLEQCFWIDLPIVAEDLGIPASRKPRRQR